MNDYDKNEESKYFLHLDINSYFKCEILSYIPGSDFKWLTHEEIKDSDTKTMQHTSKLGYLLEVILE